MLLMPAHCAPQVRGVLDSIDPALMEEVLDGPYIMSAREAGNLGTSGKYKTDTQVWLYARPDLEHAL
jgi:hypothetical protein